MITRRELLKGIGTLAGYAAATGGLIAFPKIGSAMAGNRTPEEILKSTCVQCVNFCGIEVHMQGDVIRSIFPDAARRDYYNHGICPKGVSGLFSVYNPYRVKVPLKRTNPLKGLDQDPKWVEIPWEEAFQTLAERLDKIRKDNPAKLIWQHGHGKYLIGDQFPKAFCKAFGTPNVIHRTTTCESARHVADDMTWGYHGFLPDVEHCELHLVFGSNYFEAEQYARWLDHAVTDAKERGMKVIAVEPRFSHVAAKADQWVPVRPGKDVIILLALSGLLIEAGTFDADFLLTYSNAPQLVGEDRKVLRNDKGEPLVWDSVTQTATPFGEGVVPTLRGTFEVQGKKFDTAFDVFAASLKEITPQCH
jgi:molybdopterin-containing oxidoreductase family molybdopterin binding subunit